MSSISLKSDGIAGNLQQNLIRQLSATALKRTRPTSQINGPAQTPSPAGHNKAASPQCQWVNARQAAVTLGISKATFARLRKKGHFKPSPITGRFHLDELNREAFGIPSQTLYSDGPPNGAAQTLSPSGETRPGPSSKPGKKRKKDDNK